MSSPFRTTRRVEFRDTDAAGIAHFSAFLFYMESVEHEWLRAQGLSVMPSDPANDFSWPRVSVHCDYASSARFEDVLDVEMRIGRLGEKSVTYEFGFSCGGRAIAKGRTVVVCCRVTSDYHLEGVAIPEPLAAKLRTLTA